MQRESTNEATSEIVTLQRSLLDLLYFYCNDLWVPLVPKRVISRNRVGRAFSSMTRALIANGRQHFVDSLGTVGIVSRRDFADLIAVGYKLLHSKLEKETPTERRSEIRDIETSGQLRLSREGPRERWIEELRGEARQKLNPYVHGVYVHGSVANGDYCDYSDLDTFIVLKKETVLSVERLMEFRDRCYKNSRFLYLFDPYQHHGHMLVSEIDLEFYPKAFLPPEVLRRAKVLTGKGRITLRFRDDRDDRLQSLVNISQRIIDASEESKYQSTKYFVKLFCSWIILLPVLTLQCEGEYLFKKEALQKAKQRFSKREWRPVACASAVRNAWRLDRREMPGELDRRIAKLEPTLWHTLQRMTRQVHKSEVVRLVNADFMRRAGDLAEDVLDQFDNVRR